LKNLLIDPWITFLTKSGLEDISIVDIFKRSDIIDIAEETVLKKHIAYTFLLSVCNTFLLPKTFNDRNLLETIDNFSFISDILLKNKRYFNFSEEDNDIGPMHLQPSNGKGILIKQVELIPFYSSVSAVKKNLSNFGYKNKDKYSFKETAYLHSYHIYSYLASGSGNVSQTLFPGSQKVISILDKNRESFILKLLDNTLELQSFKDKYTNFKINKYEESTFHGITLISFSNLENIFFPYENEEFIEIKNNHFIINNTNINSLYHFWPLPSKAVRFIETNGYYEFVKKEKQSRYLLSLLMHNPYFYFNITLNNKSGELKKEKVYFNQLDIQNSLFEKSSLNLEKLPISLINGNKNSFISFFGYENNKDNLSRYIDMQFSLSTFYKIKESRDPVETTRQLTKFKDIISEIHLNVIDGLNNKKKNKDSFTGLNLVSVRKELEQLKFLIYQDSVSVIIEAVSMEKKFIFKDLIIDTEKFKSIYDKIIFNKPTAKAIAYKVEKRKEFLNSIFKINEVLSTYTNIKVNIDITEGDV